MSHTKKLDVMIARTIAHFGRQGVKGREKKKGKRTAILFRILLTVTLLVSGIIPVSQMAFAATDSAISPAAASFDRVAKADVLVTMTPNGNTLNSIANAGKALVPNTDYTVSAGTVTIKRGYLALQPFGTTALTFNFSAGAPQILTITVGDTSCASAGTICTIAGTSSVAGYSGDGGAATSARLAMPSGVSVDSVGNVYIADTWNNRIRKVDASGNISTVAGTGAAGYSGDGSAATSAQLNLPYQVAIDTNGNLYIADYGNERIRKVDALGKISTLAGTGVAGYSGDGSAATSAQLGSPHGVAVDSSGNVYIADSFNNRIRKVDISGKISTVAGTGVPGYSGDGNDATSAQFNFVNTVALDSGGNMYIADFNNNRIRKVDSLGKISTVAGTGVAGYSGDGSAATLAQLNGPTGVAVDSNGNLYIAEFSNNRIRKVDTSRNISTVAGTGGQGYSGDRGYAPAAQLGFPMGVAVDSIGYVYIADLFNQRIRKVLWSQNQSIISPTVASFDKNIPAQANVIVILMLNVSTLSSVESGGTLLTSGTDYTVTGRTVTVKKEYLATQPVGTTPLTFTFSAGSPQTLAITVSDTTSHNSTITPTMASFDKNTTAQTDVTTTLTLNGNTLSSIESGGTLLTSGTDYTVTGSTVTVKKEYLATQPVGTTPLTFTFSAGSTQTLAITVSDTTMLLAPTGLTAAAGNNQAALNWNSVTGATYYNIYVRASTGAYGGTPTATVTGTTYAYTFTGLTNGTTYYFVVKAGSAAGVSSNSNEVSTTPQAAVLPTLTTVHMASSNSNSAFAKKGETVKLTFTSDMALSGLPTVTVAGRTASATTTAGNSYSTSYTFTGSENEDIVPFTIDFANAAGIAGTRVTATTDNSSVMFDKTAPTGNLVINSGAASTSSTSATLTITNSDGAGSGNVKMRFSNDNLSWSAWQAAAGTTSWTLDSGNGTKTVYMQLMDAAGNVSESTITDAIQLLISSGSSDTNSGNAANDSPPSQTETVIVNVENGHDNKGSVVSTSGIQRATDVDGQKEDEFIFTAEQAAISVEQLAAAGSNSARIVIPDPKDEVKQLSVTIPKGSTERLAKGNVNLEIFTHNVRVIIPTVSMQGATDDLNLRIVPIKSQEERKEVEQRVKTAQVVREAAGNSNIEVVGRPMTIESSTQRRRVDLVLPLGNNLLSEAQLKDLGIYIEHSDGTKQLVKGEIVPYDDSGNRGILFTVNNFSTFTIVRIDGWQQSFVHKTEHKAYLEGYADGTFGPDRNITRAEMAAVLARLVDKDVKQASKSYADVTEANWAKDDIDKVTKMGLMNGYPDGSFKPEQTITRAEMASIAAGLLHSVPNGNESFPDISGHWAQAAIEKVRAAGIMNGYEDGTFRAQQTLTRAEAVTTINKLMGRGPLYGAEPKWTDVSVQYWAYGHIQEASIDHVYEKETNGGEQYVRVP